MCVMRRRDASGMETRLSLHFPLIYIISITQITVQKFGSDAMWVITEALANCQVRLNLRGLEDLGGFWLSPRLHHYQKSHPHCNEIKMTVD